jgi:hypothetical protein
MVAADEAGESAEKRPLRGSLHRSGSFLRGRDANAAGVMRAAVAGKRVTMVQLRAADSVLDRVCGKPATAITLDVEALRGVEAQALDDQRHAANIGYEAIDLIGCLAIKDLLRSFVVASMSGVASPHLKSRCQASPVYAL